MGRVREGEPVEASEGAAVAAQPVAGMPVAGPVGEGVLGRGFRALTLGVVCTVALIAFEAVAVGTAMPVAADALHGLSAYAFAFSAYFTTSLLGMVVAGQWADRRGPLVPLAVGIAGFAAGLLLGGTAVVMWAFVLGRAVQGVGGGLVIVSLYVTVSRAYPERLRPKVLAGFAAAWVLPAIVGPLIAGTVTQTVGWRWVFLGIAPLVLVPMAMVLPPLRRAASGPPPLSEDGTAGAGAPVEWGRLRSAVGLALGVGLLQVAAQKLSPVAAVAGVLGLALLVPSALRLMPRGTYAAARGLPAVVLLRGVAAGAFVVTESFLPLLLVTQRGMSVTTAGLSLAAGGTTWAIGSWTFSRAGAEHRTRWAQLGMTLVTCGIVYVPVVLLPAVPVWTVAVTTAAACFGMGLVINATSVQLMELSEPEKAGHNSAALQMSDSLTGIVLLAVTGGAFAALGGGSVNVAGGQGASDAAGSGQPLAFVAVYAVAAAVAATGIWVAARMRVPAETPR